MEPLYVYGLEGAVTINAVELCVNNWTANESTEVVETTSTCDHNATRNRTYYRSHPTKTKLSGNITVDVDRNDFIGLRVRSGVVYPMVLKAYDGRQIEGNFRVMGIPYESGGRDGINSVSFEFENNGQYDWFGLD